MMILSILLDMYKPCWSWISLEFQEEKSKVSSINKNLFKTYFDKIKAYKLLPKVMIIPLYCKIFKHSYKRDFANLIINAWFCSLALDIHRSFLRICINTWPRIEKEIDDFWKIIKQLFKSTKWLILMFYFSNFGFLKYN